MIDEFRMYNRILSSDDITNLYNNRKFAFFNNNYDYRLFNNKGIDYWDVVAMSDASYNAGYGNVYKDMQVCKMKANCNPKIWFNNVNTTCTRNRIIYGNRSACDINRHHVRDVLLVRSTKYDQYFK